MKKIYVMVAAAMMAVASVSAQENAVQPYIELDQMPRLLDIMPPPPAFDSPEFANDVVRYGWGKMQRQDADRVALAVADAEWDDLPKLFLQWKDAFGLEINFFGVCRVSCSLPWSKFAAVFRKSFHCN